MPCGYELVCTASHWTLRYWSHCRMMASFCRISKPWWRTYGFPALWASSVYILFLLLLGITTIFSRPFPWHIHDFCILPLSPTCLRRQNGMRPRGSGTGQYHFAFDSRYFITGILYLQGLHCMSLSDTALGRCSWGGCGGCCSQHSLYCSIHTSIVLDVKDDRCAPQVISSGIKLCEVFLSHLNLEWVFPHYTCSDLSKN